MTAQVTFKRQISDSHYGSETVEVILSVPDTERVESWLRRARDLVQNELTHSPNLAVKGAMLRELEPVALEGEEDAELEFLGPDQ
jgi:hypothetical protein